MYYLYKTFCFNKLIVSFLDLETCLISSNHTYISFFPLANVLALSVILPYTHCVMIWDGHRYIRLHSTPFLFTTGRSITVNVCLTVHILSIGVRMSSAGPIHKHIHIFIRSEGWLFIP